MTTENVPALPKCRLKECRAEFAPKRPWQRFCSATCRTKFLTLERKRAMQMLRESKVRV